MEYGFVKHIDLPFDKVLTKVEEQLKNEGFGILTKIDVKEKLKEKLDIEFSSYVILGACNPKMAHQAISVEWHIGLLLPCNVIVYEKNQKVGVGIIKPTQAMKDIQNDELKRIATEVELKLKRVFDSI